MDNQSVKTHDVRATLESMPELVVSPTTTLEEELSAMHGLGSLNQCSLGLIRFAGETPWERHPDGDELLHVLDGEVDITVLTVDGAVETTVSAGSVLIVPRGLWHRQRPRPAVSLLFATPVTGSESSWADDPRRA